MNEHVYRLAEITLLTVEKLNEMSFEELVEFVEARGELIHKLNQSSADAYKDEKTQILLKETLHQDAAILGRMKELREEASQHLMKIGSARKYNQSYENNYYSGSAFVDQKK